MSRDEQPTPDDGPEVTPPSLDSETWIKAQENVLLFGNALVGIIRESEEPDTMRDAMNAIIRSGLQALFLNEEI